MRKEIMNQLQIIAIGALCVLIAPIDWLDCVTGNERIGRAYDALEDTRMRLTRKVLHSQHK